VLARMCNDDGITRLRSCSNSPEGMACNPHLACPPESVPLLHRVAFILMTTGKAKTLYLSWAPQRILIAAAFGRSNSLAQWILQAPR